MIERPSPVRLPGGIWAQTVFLVAVAAYLGVLMAGTGELSRDASLFPRVILVLATVFAVLKGVSVASPAARRYLEPDAHRGRDHAAVPAPSDDTPRGARRVLVAWLWACSTVVLMYLVGFLAGTAVAVFAWLRFVSGDSWRASAAVSAVTLAFAWFVFSRAMHIELDLGLLSRFL